VKKTFLELLVCPDCGAALDLEATAATGEEVEAGVLRCASGHAYPIVRGIPRFVRSESYAANFGFEWTLHSKTQLDTPSRRESERQLMEKTGLGPADVRGKLVLDVGCGMGRFSDVISRWGGRVVGIDLSSAVDAALGNLRERKNVDLAQADVFHLPFRPGTFDVIFSIGVLHHTPDTRAAFDSLPRLLKPGGTIAVWVYSTSMREWARNADRLRPLTTRLPKRLLYLLCHVAIPWYHLDRVARLRRFTQFLPISVNPDPEWRVLDTFDWYSPRYQWLHSEEEVRGWFERQGLVGIETLGVPTSLRGSRRSELSDSVRPDSTGTSRQDTEQKIRG
jgi:SAM-dependent methyltransferase